MDLGLRNKVALVTGGSNGIGKALALKFAEEGALVGFTYFEDKKSAIDLEEQIKKENGKAFSVQMNLSDPISIKGAIKAINNNLGQISVLVNNALGRAETQSLSDEENFSLMVNNNLAGTYLVTKSIVPQMKDKGWGRIIFISSDLAQDGLPGSAAYTAAKAGLHGLNRTLSKELAINGIFSNVVLPGLTVTDRALKRFDQGFLNEFASTYPTKRLGTPEDVANAVVYLASEANSFINGEMLRVTGGR